MLATGKRALRLLEQWAIAAEQYWHSAGDGSMGCYGPGYKHWGVQSNWIYAGVMATLASQAGKSRKKRYLDRALSSLRFALATHVSSGRPGNDGTCWGNTWISMLGIERAMHGLDGIRDEIPTSDQEALRRVLTSEADWLLRHASRGRWEGVAAGLWHSSGCNNPESNIWSGCLLWRVAGLYPDEPEAAAWKERAHQFLINGVSVAADAENHAIVAGLPVSRRHVGANFFPCYALDHHGYMNVGYMAICMSNAAMLHFDLRRANMEAPESLYHHQGDLWQVLRRMIFDDGRLARIGGDSRVRYAYCQEYLLVSLLFAADCLKDPHALGLAETQLSLIEHEAEGGGGLFYSPRLASLRRRNPHYYTRLEADRACALAMLVNYLPLVRSPSKPTLSFGESVAGGWEQATHGAVIHRSRQRFSSFAWRAHGLAQALCLPGGESSMAEWSFNLSPVVRMLGDDGSDPFAHRRLESFHISSFEGGFVTCGAVREGVNVHIDEGACCTDQALTWIAFAALPDGMTCLCLQYVAAADDRLVYLAELKDMHLVVPNDIFNLSRRTLYWPAGQTVLTSPPECDEVRAYNGSWLNIDNKLAVIALHGADRILVDRSAQRRAGRYQSLFTEEICLQVRRELAQCRPGEVLSDVGFAVLSGITADKTPGVRGGALSFSEDALRGLWVDAADGSRYELIANFSAEPRTLLFRGESLTLEKSAARLSGPFEVD